MIKNVFFILSFLLLYSCASGSKVVTIESYSDVAIQSSVKELEKQMGKPYSIKKISENEQEYEYIERVSIDERTLEERHYFFTIQDGKVVSKRMEYVNPPPLWRRNSFDLQTSQNE